MMPRIVSDGICRYESTLLRDPTILHGFGCKDRLPLEYLRARRARSVIVPETHQVHGAAAHCCDGPITARLVGDAFCSVTIDCCMAVRTADCLPILWCEPRRGVVGAIHAGWRGLAAGVISAAVTGAVARYGISVAELRVAIGPAMGASCYEVGGEVVDALERSGHRREAIARSVPSGRWLLDLTACAKVELQWRGVRAERIDTADICTHCAAEEFHSYRRDPTSGGRQYSYIVRVA